MSLNNEQLDHYIRVIMMHDVKTNKVEQKDLFTLCKQILEVLALNFRGQYDPKTAQRIAFRQLAQA